MTREAMPQGETPCVYVIHENDAWLEPLRGEFEARGVPYAEWSWTAACWTSAPNRPRESSTTG